MNPDGWLDFSISVALRSVPLAGACALFYLALRRGSNRLRFGATIGSFAALAVLPFLLGLLPRFEWALLPGREVSGGPAAVFDPRWGILLPWFSGAAWFLLRLIRCSRAAGRLRRKSVEITSESTRRILCRLSQQLGLRTPVRLAFSPTLSRPVVCGLWRPAILLPPQAVEWSPARLERVLAHELAHIARRDLWSQWFCQVIAALYWFNPLVWKLATWQVREREIAADELALSITGDNRAGYARELLAIATEPVPAISPAVLPAAAAMLGATSRLEDRISCLFGANSASRLNRLTLTLACLIALTVFAACTAFDPVASHSPGPWTDDEVRLRLTADPFPGS